MTASAAVVGLGRIGAGFQRDPLRVGAVTHAGAYVAHPGVELVGGVDPDPGQRAAFEADFGVPAYATLESLLADHRPALVSVCVPPPAHAEVVLAAVAANAARVLCEKPFTPSFAEARALVDALGSAAGRVGVNYSRRYDPLHLQLLGLVAGEALCGGTGRYTAGIRNTASHWLANLVAAGGEVEQVLAMPSVPGDDPTPTIVLGLVGGAHVYLEGHDVRDHLLFELDLVTDSHRIQLLDSGERGVLFERAPSPMFSGYHELRPADADLPRGMVGPMLPVVDDAVRSIAEDRPPVCGVSDALAVHAIIEAALLSLDAGAWMTVRS